MSQAKVSALKSYLEAEGFVEEEDFHLSGEGQNIQISVTIPIEDVELPEELKSFAWGGDQVERAIWKGNAEKQTWNGANFELALQGYASDLMRNDPEAIALEETLKTQRTLEELKDYQAKRKEIWERAVNGNPKIIAWEKELEENYL